MFDGVLKVGDGHGFVVTHRPYLARRAHHHYGGALLAAPAAAAPSALYLGRDLSRATRSDRRRG